MENNKPKGNIKQTLITVIIVLCGVMLLFTRNGRYKIFKIFKVPEHKEYVNEVFADETFKDLEEKGYNIETLQKALEEEKAESFIHDELLIQNVEISEWVKFVSKVQFVEVEASFQIQDVKYTLHMSTQYYRKKQYSHETRNTNYNIVIENKNDKSILEMKQLPFDKTILDKLGEYIGVHNAYDIIDSKRKKMNYNEKEGNYSYTEDHEISIDLREYKEQKYNFYCSISK